MKQNLIALAALGFVSGHTFALEAPQKVEPLAPLHAPEAKPEAKQEGEAEVEAQAIPIEEKPDIANKAVEKMPLVQNQKAYMGLGLDAIPSAMADHLGLDANACALVRVIDPNGPAAAAGLEQNDIIRMVDGTAVNSHQCLSEIMEKHQAGDEVKVTYLHRGKEQEKSITLAARAVDEIAGFDGEENAGAAVPQEMLRALPPEMRDALEKNLKELEDGIVAEGGRFDMRIIPQLQRRAEKMKQEGDLPQQDAAAPNIQFQMKSSIHLMDEEGKIEIHRDGESAEAKVYDKQGELLWSGPYVTPQDKAAIPPPILERLNSLDIDINDKGMMLKRLRK
jgi:serine protease Do